MNTILQIPVDDLDSLHIPEVRRYLVRHGWQHDDAASNADASVFRYPGLRDAEAILPRRRQFVDYAQRMADIVYMLAAVEQRAIWHVLADLLSSPDEPPGALPTIDFDRREIEGLVICLKADPSLFSDFEGTVVLKADLAGTMARVQVPLGADDYKRACDAHRDRRPVRVSGLLHREAKLYQLRQPQNFSVVGRL